MYPYLLKVGLCIASSPGLLGTRLVFALLHHPKKTDLHSHRCFSFYKSYNFITLILCFQIYYNDSDAVGTKVSHRVATIDGVAVKTDSAV